MMFVKGVERVTQVYMAMKAKMSARGGTWITYSNGGKTIKVEAFKPPMNSFEAFYDFLDHSQEAYDKSHEPSFLGRPITEEDKRESVKSAWLELLNNFRAGTLRTRSSSLVSHMTTGKRSDALGMKGMRNHGGRMVVFSGGVRMSDPLTGK